ncbi:MAG TPA: hypothetical protein VFD58_36050 [Blastocatellia bacterium]|nr:hypothetical protein [Blastocatellia bacterium]
MKSRHQIAVVAAQTDLPPLIESIKAATGMLAEDVEVLACTPGAAVTPVMLAAADVVVAGAAVEAEADDQKLIELLRAVRLARGEESRHSSMAIVWGARARAVARGVTHSGIFCPEPRDSSRPPDAVVRECLQQMLALVEPLGPAERYQLLAAAFGQAGAVAADRQVSKNTVAAPDGMQFNSPEWPLLVDNGQPPPLAERCREILWRLKPPGREQHRIEVEILQRSLGQFRAENELLLRRHREMESALREVSESRAAQAARLKESERQVQALSRQLAGLTQERNILKESLQRLRAEYRTVLLSSVAAEAAASGAESTTDAAGPSSSGFVISISESDAAPDPVEGDVLEVDLPGGDPTADTRESKHLQDVIVVAA